MGVANAILGNYSKQLNATEKQRFAGKVSPAFKALDSSEFSPLGIAILENQVEIAKIFIKAQIDLENGFANFGTALHLAISECNSEIVEMLLKTNLSPNAKNENKQSPIHLAMSILSNLNQPVLPERLP